MENFDPDWMSVVDEISEAVVSNRGLVPRNRLIHSQPHNDYVATFADNDAACRATFDLISNN